jgi:hypothetical protein
LEGCDLGGRYVRIAWSAAPLDARSCPLVTASGVGYWHGDGMFDHGTDANCESGAAAPADAGLVRVGVVWMIAGTEEAR